MIIQGYIGQSEKIADALINLIGEKFSQEIILGRVSETTHVLLFQNKVLLITYSEDRTEMIRYIDDIIIAERR